MSTSAIGTWIFNDDIDFAMPLSEDNIVTPGSPDDDTSTTTNQWSLNFTDANSSVYTSLITKSSSTAYYMDYDDVVAYTWSIRDSSGSWGSTAYKTITITSGDDVENEVFVAWLEMNATLQDDTGGGEDPDPGTDPDPDPGTDPDPSENENDTAVGTWILNESVTPIDGTYYIDYTSNGGVFSKFVISKTSDSTLIYGLSTSSSSEVTPYVSSTGWAYSSYRTITITGGDDATNVYLIAWFEANGVKQAESESGTAAKNAIGVWYFNETLTDIEGVFDLDFISGGLGFDTLICVDDSETSPFALRMDYYLSTGSSTSATSVYTVDDVWTSQDYRTIEITGGDAITNEELITWLEENAIKKASPLRIECTSTSGVTLVTAGKYCPKNIKVVPKLQNKTVTSDGTVTPDSGYAGLGTVIVEGSGSVSALQEYTITPTTEVQEVLPEEGYDGFSKVTVEAISTEEGSVDVAAAGTVEVTPSQDGIYLSKVTVTTLPGVVNTSDATAEAASMLDGTTAYVAGVLVTGSIPTYNGEYVYPATAVLVNGEDISTVTYNGTTVSQILIKE